MQRELKTFLKSLNLSSESRNLEDICVEFLEIEIWLHNHQMSATFRKQETRFYIDLRKHSNKNIYN